MSIIAVFNQKGGVGKTTTALNLSAALHRIGRATYAIDLDPQAQLSAISDITATSGADTVLSVFQNNRPLRDLVRPSPNGLQVIPAHTELSKVDVLFGKGYNVVNKLNSAMQAERLGDRDNPLIMDCSPLIG
ncbi:MAG: AAA family ATPase, partial [Pseudomonadota bacterium]